MEIDLRKFKHKTKIKIRFSDLDAMQHVNNATYLTFLEEARIDYFSHLFNRNYDNLDFEAVVGRIEINYIHPIVFGDEVEVLTRISKIGTKSIDVEHVIVINKKNDTIKAAVAITKLVYYDYKNKTTRVIPEEAKNIIVNFEGIKI